MCYLVGISYRDAAKIAKFCTKKAAFHEYIKSKLAFLYSGDVKSVEIIQNTKKDGIIYKKTIQKIEK